MCYVTFGSSRLSSLTNDKNCNPSGHRAGKDHPARIGILKVNKRLAYLLEYNCKDNIWLLYMMWCNLFHGLECLVCVAFTLQSSQVTSMMWVITGRQGAGVDGGYGKWWLGNWIRVTSVALGHIFHGQTRQEGAFPSLPLPRFLLFSCLLYTD